MVGDKGNGIVSIVKTSTSGLVDTYTITYDDGNTTTFTVTNGSNATVDIVTAWNSTTSDSKVPSEKLVKNNLDGKSNTGHTHTVSNITDFPSSIDPMNNSVSASSTNLKDLNDYTTVGFYNFFNDATIPYVSNVPTEVTHSFFLLVEARANGNQAKQTLTDYYTGKTFIRTKNTTWGNWKEIAKLDSLTTLIPNTTTQKDLNDYTTTGFYACNSNDYASYITNNPFTNKAFYLLVETLGTSSYVKQTCTHYSNGTTYVRVKNSSTWGSWTAQGGGGSSVDIATSWGSTLSDTKVPSEKLVKNSLPTKVSDLTNDSGFITSSSLPTKTSDLTNDGDGNNPFLTQHQSLSNYIQKSSTSGLIKNDGTIDTNTYLTQHQSLANYLQKSNTSGLVKNDGTIDTNTYLTQHQSLANYVQKSSTSGLLKNDGTVDTNTYLTQHQSLANYIQKSNTSGLLKNDGTVDTSSYITSSAITGMLTSSDIVDNLTTDNASKVLSAKQGKALKDLIGNAISYINQ